MEAKRILKHPSYVVSDDGKIYSDTPSGLKELRFDFSNGYPRVKLDGVKEYVSKLVAEAFLDLPKTKSKLSYIDGDRTNCRADNLIWLSDSDLQRYSHYTTEYRKKALKGMGG